MSWIQTLEYRANALVGAFAIFSGLLIEYLLLSNVFKNEMNSNKTRVLLQDRTDNCMKLIENQGFSLIGKSQNIRIDLSAYFLVA